MEYHRGQGELVVGLLAVGYQRVARVTGAFSPVDETLGGRLASFVSPCTKQPVTWYFHDRVCNALNASQREKTNLAPIRR
jgi:hypothetical protein